MTWRKPSSSSGSVKKKAVERPAARGRAAAGGGGAVGEILAPGLRVLFVGINPGRVSAAAGHNFANSRNVFWRALWEAGFTPELLRPQDEGRLPSFGLGLTNSVSRVTAGSGDLTAADFDGALERLEALAVRLSPGWLAFVGKDAYAPLFRPRRRVELGVQEERLGGARVFVLPSTSPTNAAVTPAQKIAWFARLRAVAWADGDD